MCSKEEKDDFCQRFNPHAHFVSANLHSIDPVPPTQSDHVEINIAETVENPADVPLSEEAKNLYCVSVADEKNQNLSGPQRELLHWHHRLCLNMQDLQELMRERVIRDQSGRVVARRAPVIKCKYASTKNLKPERYPFSLADKLATAKRRSTGVTTSKPVPSKEGALSRDQYEPGDSIATDQFVVKTPGRLKTGYGRESLHNCYSGGTIFQDAASNLVRVQPQISLGAGETVLGKASFEEWIWNLGGVLAKHYHSDNGIFISQGFRDDCRARQQTQTFSGVGAKHQNARAERTIQTISYWARRMMVHASVHWPCDGADDIRLWAFAVLHAAWLYNRLPNKNLAWRSPLEVFTKTQSDHRDLLRAHVWGCPVFVLEPRLQDGQKIPKFNRRARMGQFLGFSDEHSTLVSQVRNLSTNFVSPQFHVVYGDLFSCIYNNVKLQDTKIEAIFSELFESCCDYYGEEPFPTPEGDEAKQPIDECPKLGDDWLTKPERREKKCRLEAKKARQLDVRRDQAKDFEKLNSEYNPPYPFSDDSSEPPQLMSDDDDSSIESDSSDGPTLRAPEGATPAEGVQFQDEGPPTAEIPPVPVQVRRSRRLRGEQPVTPNVRRSQRLRGDRVGAYRAKIEEHPNYERCSYSLVTDRMRDDDYIKEHRDQFCCTLGNKQPPRRAKHSRKQKEYKARLFRKKLREANQSFGTSYWEVSSTDALVRSDLAHFVHFAATEAGFDGSVESLVVNWLHPLMLAAKSKGNDADNPNWLQAMNGPFAQEYWEAACVEVETLERMDAWSVEERTLDMNVLPSTWAFKCKRYPDGLIKKFKARFCARGDRQIEGVDFFETYASVVQWTTIRLMLILEALLDLTSKQGDVTCAFLHAHLEPGEEVYVQMPKGFVQYDRNQRSKVLKLKRCLYGLKQSPRAFWKYMVEKLAACGMKQSELDPCLFIGNSVITVMYVDDILMWSPSPEHIYKLRQNLREQGVDIEEEDDAAGFLGLKLTKNEGSGQILTTQEGLTTRIIEALGLDGEMSKGHKTPCLKAPLTKDLDGDLPEGNFSYSSIVGMLLYLSGRSRPDIAYSVSCVARFTFAPKRSHEQALKRIGRYLLMTRDKGLVLNPTKTLNINAYPDADFAGLYGYETVWIPSVYEVGQDSLSLWRIVRFSGRDSCRMR